MRPEVSPWLSDLPGDAVARALPEELVLLVELPLVLADGDVEALLLEVRLLLLTDGGLLQHLVQTQREGGSGQSHQQQTRVLS